MITILLFSDTNVWVAPSTPAISSATLDNLTTARVRWAASGSPGTGSLASYTVASDHDNLIVTVPASQLFAVVPGLNPNALYTFRVWATNTYGINSAPSAWSNPASLPVISNDVYRMLDGESVFTRIATGLAPDAHFVDYNVPIGVGATYYVVGISSTGAIATSATASTALAPTDGMLLHALGSPAATMLNLLWDEQRSETLEQAAALVQYAGRSRPVAEFDGTGGRTVRAGITIRSTAPEYAKLTALLRAQDIICWRDQRKRRVFGVLRSLPFTDDFGVYTTTVEVNEVDYSEAV